MDKNEHLRNVAIISIAFLLTHGIITFITGTWWDDKIGAFATDEELWRLTLQLGKPSAYFLTKFYFSIPEIMARLTILLCFYSATLGMYYIYQRLPYINARRALYLTLIYNALPINDARIMVAVFPYTVGYMLFIIAFCGLILLHEKYDYKNIVFRILVLFLFFCSFILNSNLVMYIIPLLYIIYYLINNKLLHKWYCYIDFLVSPIVYFLIKNTFYPAYGVYDGYNKISGGRLLQGFIKTFSVCIERVGDCLALWTQIKFAKGLIVIILVAVLYTVYKHWKNRENKPDVYSATKKCLKLMGLGYIAMYFGAYAYVVIGQSCRLNDMIGRSSILLGIGLAVIFYALIRMIPHKKLQAFAFGLILFCGLVHFNMYYLSYQQDYYRQQDFVYELRANSRCLDATKNIYYITNDTSLIHPTRFYTLNANGRVAFGDQTHFFMESKDDYSYLRGTGRYNLETFVHSTSSNMSDYNIGRSNEIEAFVKYNNDIGLLETARLKWYEMVDYAKFEQELYGEKNLEIYTRDMPEYKQLMSDLELDT